MVNNSLLTELIIKINNQIKVGLKNYSKIYLIIKSKKERHKTENKRKIHRQTQRHKDIHKGANTEITWTHTENTDQHIISVTKPNRNLRLIPCSMRWP